MLPLPRVASFIALGALLIALDEHAFAQQPYYRWVDDKGVVNYSQFPPPSPPKEATAEPRAEPPKAAPRDARASGAAAAGTPFGITVSREVTFLVAPLRADGSVDYAAGLNARYGRGVTPDSNAAVLWIRALGPGAFLTGDRGAGVLGRLGMPALPATGDYWAGREPAETLKAAEAPWRDSEYPAVAAWLKSNAKPLALIVEASKRPRFWIPVGASKTGGIDPTGLAGVNVGPIGRALSARAMHKLQSRDVEGAWSDLSAGQRLARLISHGHTLIDLLLGAQIDRYTGKGIEILARSGTISAAQARAFLSALRALPRFPSVVEIEDQADRMTALSLLTPRGGVDFETLATFLEAPGLQRVSSVSHIDWNETLRALNQCYERSVAALRTPGLAARRAAARALTKELEAVRGASRKTLSVESVTALLRTGPDAASRTTLGRTLGQLYCSIRDVAGLVTVEERMLDGEARLRLNQVALALAAYRVETGRFPARLADLSPGHLAPIPKDPFTERPLSYAPRGGGYILYSVGPNQKPDRAVGAKTGDEDDLVVKME